MVLAKIIDHQGVLPSDLLWPYLSNHTTISDNVREEDIMRTVLVRYDGTVEASDDGKLVYTFHELLFPNEGDDLQLDMEDEICLAQVPYFHVMTKRYFLYFFHNI